MEQPIELKGYLEKKKPKSLIGLYQKRYFQVIDGRYLGYASNPTSKSKGMIDFSKVLSIADNGNKDFTIHYEGRNFKLRATTLEEKMRWIMGLTEIVTNIASSRPVDIRAQSMAFPTEESVEDSNSPNRAHTGSFANTFDNALQKIGIKKKNERKKSWKLSNMNREAADALKRKESFDTFVENVDIKGGSSAKTKTQKLELLSEKALEKKGILSYIKKADPQKLESRMLYGFLNKRSKGKVKYFQRRWFWLISSRPLIADEYQKDDYILSDTYIPIRYEFDTIYYFPMDDEKDERPQIKEGIPTAQILRVLEKDMGESHDSGYTFLIDLGEKIFHLNSGTKYEMERWVEACKMSRSTALEIERSVTGHAKNIIKILQILDSDPSKLKAQLSEQFFLLFPAQRQTSDELELLLEGGRKVQEELIPHLDGCLAVEPERQDLVTIFMEIWNDKLISIFSKYWEKYALSLDPVGILDLIKWSNSYNEGLKQFGIRHDSLSNGYESLCNAYARKVENNLSIPLNNILSKEEDSLERSEEDNALYSSAPYDLFKLFETTLQTVRPLKLKELFLRVLKLLKHSIEKYQIERQKILESKGTTNSPDFLVACSNNSYQFFLEMEKLVEAAEREKICSAEEIKKVFPLNDLNYNFKTVSKTALEILMEIYFSQKIGQGFKVGFLELRMNKILEQTYHLMEDSLSKLNSTSQIDVYLELLERTVLAYIQCLLNSSSKLKQTTSNILAERLDRDKELIEGFFSEISDLSEHAMKYSMEIIDQLKDFLEASSDFLSMTCKKLRETHGPEFKVATVKALLNFRTDLTKTEKLEALRDCAEVLKSFERKGSVGRTERNFFKKLDLTKIEKDEELDASGLGSIDEGTTEKPFDMESFLKEGGIEGENEEDLDSKATSGGREELLNLKQIEGWALKEKHKTKMRGKLKYQKRWFSLINGTLYWYLRPKARNAQNSIAISTIKELQVKKDRGIILDTGDKKYKLKLENREEREKWVKCIQFNQEDDSEDITTSNNRFLNVKIYEKIGGRSMFKDYDQMVEEVENAKRQIERETYLRKKREIEEQKAKEKRSRTKPEKLIKSNKKNKKLSTINNKLRINNANSTNITNELSISPPSGLLSSELKPNINDRPVNEVKKGSLKLKQVPAPILGSMNTLDSDDGHSDQAPPAKSIIQKLCCCFFSHNNQNTHYQPLH